MGKIRCEQADFAEFAALPTNDRQFVIPNMFSIENWIINVEFATENYSPNSRNSRLKISLMQWRFKITVFASHCWMFLCSCSRITRGDPPRKSSSPIRGAEYFRPLHKFKGVDSAQKVETGLECDQRLLRKLKNTVTGAHCAMLLCEHSVSQFSQQPLTAFESRFDFPDRINTVKHRQRPKTFSRANRSLNRHCMREIFNREFLEFGE